MTRVFFALLDDRPPPAKDLEYLDFVRQEVATGGKGEVVLADTPDDAELVVLLENSEFKFLEYIERLRRSPLLARFPEKVLTLNYEDAPNGALSGLFSSLRPEQYCREIHRSWPHVCLPNEKIHGRPVSDIDSAKLLFSFRGNFSSNPIRPKLGRLYGDRNESYAFESIDRWYNHTADDKESYLAHIENATFALCPRGIAAYSHRLAEVMALNRVPVIVADGWIPFDFEEKEPFYIQIAEADMVHIPQILRERRGDARALAAQGRKLFERYLSIGNRFPEAVRALRQIQANRPADWMKRFYTDRWPSRKFWRVNGWALDQRLMRKVKQLAKR